MRRILAIFAIVSLSGAAQTKPDEKGRYERVAALGKLWTFIKYLDPRVTSDVMDWDVALLAAIPKASSAVSDKEFAVAVADMLKTLADPATRLLTSEELEPPKGSNAGPAVKTMPDGVKVVQIGNSEYMTAEAAVQDMWPTLARSKAVVFDIRGSGIAGSVIPSNWPVSKSGAGPGFASRRHSGYVAPDTNGSGGYYSSLEIRTGLRLQTTHEDNGVRAVFLVDKSSSMPPLALALQAIGQGAVVSEGPIDDQQAEVSEAVPVLDDLKATVRVKELYYPDETTGLNANRVLTEKGDAALNAAIDMATAGKWEPAARRRKINLSGADYREKSYADTPYPNREMRMLAAIRIWGVYHYFHPYNQLIGEDWDAVLTEFLPKMASAADARQYHLAVAEMVSRTRDTHCFVSSQELRRYYGVAPPPFEVRWIENRPAITRLLDVPEVKWARLKPGDIIIKFDGEPVQKRIDDLSRHVAASTPQSMMMRITQTLLNGDDGSFVNVTVQGEDGNEREVRVKRSSENFSFLRPSRSGEVFRLINDKIGYVDLERLDNTLVDEMFEKFRNTQAIIMDMRGYPRGTAWTIAPRLSQKTSPVAAEFRRNVVSGQGIEDNHITSFVFEQRLPPTGNWRYKGKTVLLVDERAISQSEHSGLFYKAANNTIFIGSPTAGANGDVTWFWAPGGIRINFSGHDVRWPDGRQLQRVGLIPDVEVKPTIAGIRAGRDEVLEKAISYLTVPTGK